MGWDAVSAISQVIAAIAVVISLIYIAAQVRSGAESFKTTLRDSSFTSLMEYNYAILADENLAWVFQEGMRDLGALSEAQQARAVHAFYAFFKVWENIYLHYLAGFVDDSVWKNNSRVLFAYGALPGAQQYLRGRMPIFEQRFQELLLGPKPVASPSGDIAEALYRTEAQQP
jgi:hypothetical protein